MRRARCGRPPARRERSSPRATGCDRTWVATAIRKGDADYATRVYPREIVEAGPGDWRNWRGIGTGPFLLEDFVEGSTVTYVRNPTYTVPYWDTATINGKEYEIPFIDRLVHSLITDISSQIAALRTGKIDQHDNLTAEYVESLQNTNPEMQFMSKPSPRKHYVGMRWTRSPLTISGCARRWPWLSIDKPLLTLYGVVREVPIQRYGRHHLATTSRAALVFSLFRYPASG